MDFYSEYRSKLRTPEQAVQCVKSGDWIDYTSQLGFPILLDRALSKRRDELFDVKIRGNLIFNKLETVEGLEGWQLLEAAARKRGFLISGGEVDIERMAATLLKEFHDGVLGRISLEAPPKDG